MAPTAARFVGGHPVCGSEARGAAAARAELFDGATYFLTPVHDTDPRRFAQVHAMVTAIGSRPVAIDPVAHDRLSRSPAIFRTWSRTCWHRKRVPARSTVTIRSRPRAARSAT